MKIVQQTGEIKIANEIQRKVENLIGFVDNELAEVYSMVNTPGKEQAVLDQFGVNANAALEAYAAFHTALSQLGVPLKSQAPDLNVFQAQEDGTVIFAG